MKNLLFVATLACFLCSCSESNKNDKIKQIKVDILETPDMEQTKKFQDRLNISLMQLETTDESIFSITRSNIVVNKGNMFFLDKTQNSIFRYNKDGKFICKIDRVGNGPKEYSNAFNITTLGNSIYVLDYTCIQQYDFDGNHINTIPVSDKGRQIVAIKDGNLAVLGGLNSDYALTIYNPRGGIIANYFPNEKNFREGNLSRCAISSLKCYGDNLYVTNYLDNNVYMITGNKVDTLLNIDFGQYNIPDEMFKADPPQKLDVYDKFRRESVMCVDYLTVNDDWIIFSPEIFRTFMVIYYNRKDNSIFSNKAFTPPYSTLFGRYLAPLHYDSQDKVYYATIGSFELKEMLEELSEIDPNYQTTYSFLKGLEADKIDEESNGWLIKWSIDN